jgi:hypothetical protein
MGKFGRGRRASRSSGVRVCSECLTVCNEILAEQPSRPLGLHRVVSNFRSAVETCDGEYLFPIAAVAQADDAGCAEP